MFYNGVKKENVLGGMQMKDDFTKQNNTRDIAITGLLIALVCVCTMSISMPLTSYGYVHLGDSMILFAGVVFGRKKGMLAGGLGSMLADLLLGYVYWAPFTLVIKGAMGYIAGTIGHSKNTSNNFFTMPRLLGGIASELVMIAGYFITGVILLESVEIAFLDIPANVIQAGMGFVLYVVFGCAFYRTGLQNTLVDYNSNENAVSEDVHK